MSAWIDVREKLPIEEKNYLTFRSTPSYPKGSVEMRWWIQKDVWSRGFYSDGEQDTNVTHWMELPEPPAERGA